MKQALRSQTFGRPAVYLASLMVLVGSILPTDLLAVPITYTAQTVTSGFFGLTSYSDALTIIVFNGDTGNVVNQGGGFFTNASGPRASL